MKNIARITDPDELIDAIAELTDQVNGINATIKEQCIRAVQIGARRYSVSAAALISRPTLNAWIDNQK